MKILKFLSIMLVSFIIYVILTSLEFSFFNIIDIHVYYLDLFLATYNVCIVGMVSFLTSLNLHYENNWN